MTCGNGPRCSRPGTRQISVQDHDHSRQHVVEESLRIVPITRFTNGLDKGTYGTVLTSLISKIRRFAAQRRASNTTWALSVSGREAAGSETLADCSLPIVHCRPGPSIRLLADWFWILCLFAGYFPWSSLERNQGFSCIERFSPGVANRAATRAANSLARSKSRTETLCRRDRCCTRPNGCV